MQTPLKLKITKYTVRGANICCCSGASVGNRHFGDAQLFTSQQKLLLFHSACRPSNSSANHSLTLPPSLPHPEASLEQM